MSKQPTSQTPDFVDPEDAPPVTQADLDRAVFRVGLKPVAREKVHVDVDLDAAIVQFFKNKASGGNYRRLINEALTAYVFGHNVENMLRRVIREEMQRQPS
ncbi:MAG: BrnA antitoxin family protein [bacterium]|nr:BrnA antitoxin family protein [bacterium]